LRPNALVAHIVLALPRHRKPDGHRYGNQTNTVTLTVTILTTILTLYNVTFTKGRERKGREKKGNLRI
jgi:hypothetical protein